MTGDGMGQSQARIGGQKPKPATPPMMPMKVAQKDRNVSPERRGTAAGQHQPNAAQHQPDAGQRHGPERPARRGQRGKAKRAATATPKQNKGVAAKLLKKITKHPPDRLQAARFCAIVKGQSGAQTRKANRRERSATLFDMSKPQLQRPRDDQHKAKHKKGMIAMTVKNPHFRQTVADAIDRLKIPTTRSAVELANDETFAKEAGLSDFSVNTRRFYISGTRRGPTKKEDLILDDWSADVLATAIENASPDGVMDQTDLQMIREHILPALRNRANNGTRPYSKCN